MVTRTGPTKSRNSKMFRLLPPLPPVVCVHKIFTTACDNNEHASTRSLTFFCECLVSIKNKVQTNHQVSGRVVQCVVCKCQIIPLSGVGVWGGHSHHQPPCSSAPLRAPDSPTPPFCSSHRNFPSSKGNWKRKVSDAKVRVANERSFTELASCVR